MARLKTAGPDNAWQRLRGILVWFDEVQSAGGCILDPQRPSDWKELQVTRIHLQDHVLDVRATDAAIDVADHGPSGLSLTFENRSQRTLRVTAR